MPSSPTTILDNDTALAEELDSVWVCLLHNDPVNTFEYVIYALGAVFGYPREHCELLTQQAHTNGRTAVSNGNFEEASAHAMQLGAYHLWATVARDR